MKKVLAILLALTLVFSLAACAGAPAESDPAPEDKEGAKATAVIGVSLPQLDADGYHANLIGIETKAKEFGYTVQPVDAQNSAEEQTRQIEDFITAKVDAIIFIPVDSAAMVSAVKAANTAGIPIVSMDRSVEGGDLTALVESDNKIHGEQAAELMLKAAEAQGLKAADLKVLELLGDQASSAGLERHEGFSEKCKSLGITIVSSLPTHWQADEAYSSTLDAFQTDANINAIFEASDIAMHSGVISALEQLSKKAPAGEDGHIIITTVDGGPQGIDNVKQGFIDGIAQQSLLDMGGMAMEAAAHAIKGEAITEPIIRISPVLVTKENAESKDLWTAKVA
ncbi:MAG: sugar ABC transporter substrate-binding protein [Oscillospiraceae bacterium]